MEHTPPPAELKQRPEELRRALHATIDRIRDPEGLEALLRLVWYCLPQRWPRHGRSRTAACEKDHTVPSQPVAPHCGTDTGGRVFPFLLPLSQKGHRMHPRRLSRWYVLGLLTGGLVFGGLRLAWVAPQSLSYTATMLNSLCPTCPSFAQAINEQGIVAGDVYGQTPWELARLGVVPPGGHDRYWHAAEWRRFSGGARHQWAERDHWLSRPRHWPAPPEYDECHTRIPLPERCVPRPWGHRRQPELWHGH